MIIKIIHKIWYEIVRLVLLVTFYPTFRVSAEGGKNVPKKGPVMLLSNHQSFLDPMLCQIPLTRHMHHVARTTLYDNKLFGILLSTLYTIPIRRGEADVAAMKKIIRALKEGKMVCLFPEGTRTSDGRIADVKAGFSLLSRRSNAVVVPVVIEGAYYCWPRDRRFPRLGKICIKYGEGFTPEKIKELGDEEFLKVFNKKIHAMQNELRVKLKMEPFDYDHKDEQ
jgi:1-acyl-sn-glycerol-3-phosphate acyltransferase